MVGGRRRTDAPDALWRGVPDAGLSDHPTAPGRERGRLEATPSRRPTAAAVANRPPEHAGQMSRSRLPLPPVPAAARPAAKPVRAEASSTGPTGLRAGAPAPRVPRQTAGGSDARYGDWTKPSRDLPSEEEMRAALAPSAPSTSLIPERSVGRRGADLPDIEDLVDEVPAPPTERPAGRTPVGGRAALRAERQAAELARQKAAKDSGVALLDEEPRRSPRRVARGLVAMGVVALGVLGVYQFTSPQTDEVAATTANVPTAPIAPGAPLPELAPEAPPVEPVDSTPVRVPVVVLNATDITGLAAKISGAVVSGGWESPGVGAYEGDDVPASTVFFTEGDETQRQAAVQLVDQFPQLQGPAPRFFELPAEITTPSLVVVATGDWTP